MTAVSEAPARPEVSDPPWPRWVRPLYVGVVAIGLLLFFATKSDLWLDETLSVNIAHLPWSQLHEALKQDGSPPLYYAMLHVWTSLFGTGDFAVRSLSGVLGVAMLVALWFTTRRVLSERAAWFALLLTATSPFAIRYATETRMYMLEILVVTCGILAFLRALEQPSIGRLAVFALVVALLAYTQYWCLYLLAVTFGTLCLLAWRGPHTHAARRLLIAFIIGCAMFLPWMPTFMYQRAHTGTPWGSPVLPAIPVGTTFLDFSGTGLQEGWALFLITIPLLLLGVFSAPSDDLEFELDLRGAPEIRWFALFGIAMLVVANVMNYVAGGAWQSRYSALFFPFFALVFARAFTVLHDRKVLAVALVVVVGLGLVSGVRNFKTQRTTAGRVAAVINHEAQSGDLVLFCPDQVGPAVNRLLRSGLDQVTYPLFKSPERVDWVDYVKVLHSVKTPDFVREALARAGTHTIWYVPGPGYRTHRGICEEISDTLGRRRQRIGRLSSDSNIFEKPGLQEFPNRPPTRDSIPG